MRGGGCLSRASAVGSPRRADRAGGGGGGGGSHPVWVRGHVSRLASGPSCTIIKLEETTGRRMLSRCGRKLQSLTQPPAINQAAALMRNNVN